MKEIGEILRNAREDNDLTQIQVMKITGINNKTLSGYENGIAEPDIDTLITLFKLYKISADEVFDLKKYTDHVKISDEEILLLEKYRKIDDRRQKDTLKILTVLAQDYED